MIYDILYHFPSVAPTENDGLHPFRGNNKKKQNRQKYCHMDIYKTPYVT